MKTVRRWLILPILLVLVGAILLLMGKIHIDSNLPLNIIAPIAAVIAGFLLLVLIGLEAQTIAENWELPEPEDPPTSDKVIYPKPLKKAEESMAKAEKFSKNKKEKIRIEIDVEDARDD